MINSRKVIGKLMVKNGKSWENNQQSRINHGFWDLPSGKRLHNYGTSTFLPGKSTFNGHSQSIT